MKPVSDSETGFGFSGFLHSIGETETGFAKPSKPSRDMVSLAKPEIVHVFMLNYTLATIPSRRYRSLAGYGTVKNLM